MDKALKQLINDTNPGCEKRFELSYLNVEKRFVTVRAKTVEEAFKKATSVVASRHKSGYVSGERFDDKFTIRWLHFLKAGVKRFRGAPYGSVERSDTRFEQLQLEPADLELLDNESQAA